MGFLGTLLALTITLPAVVDAQQARLQAEQLTIMGDNGAERIRLQTGPGIAAALLVLDANGNRRAQLATGLGPQGTGDRPEGVGLNIYDAQGGMAGRLGFGDDGSRVVNLHDANARPRIRLQVTNDGTPAIQILDAAGTVTWSAP
jgi:hypothetical protein